MSILAFQIRCGIAVHLRCMLCHAISGGMSAPESARARHETGLLTFWNLGQRKDGSLNGLDLSIRSFAVGSETLIDWNAWRVDAPMVYAICKMRLRACS
jgi:hypothetical protein